MGGLADMFFGGGRTTFLFSTHKGVTWFGWLSLHHHLVWSYFECHLSRSHVEPHGLSLSWGDTVKLLRSPSDCRDPIRSKINPLPLLQLCSDHPLRLWHYTNQAPELRAPPGTSNTLLLLSKNSEPSKNPNHIPVFIYLHHSILVLLNSNLIFMSSSQFSPFHFRYIKPFQYSCSLILASALPLYISTSFLLNSSNSL